MSLFRRHGPVLAKYLLMQIPGLFAVAGLLYLAVQWWELSTTVAGVFLGLWFLKDLAMFPVLRRAYEPAEPSPAAALVGTEGVVTRRLAPDGYVRLGAESWQARPASGSGPLEAGTRVRVESVSGLRLVVAPSSPSQSSAANQSSATARKGS